MKYTALTALLLLALALTACAPKVNFFSPPASIPLKEAAVDGSGDEKIALIYLKGILESQPKKGTFVTSPSQVQDLVSNLKIAAADEAVRGVILAIDSPGGTTTASDILYHEIMMFKQRTNKKVVVVMMDIATSGGYYAALPADWIIAHPTTVTGSVGVIYLRPKLQGLMDKVGVEIEVAKSGTDKDMGSPFRPTTPEEEAMFQAIVDDYAARFHMLLTKHRTLTPDNLALIKTARVFTANQALEVGLVDQIGYLQDTFAKARQLSGTAKDARIVTYRRNNYPNDNPYNTMTATDVDKLNLLGVDTSMIMPPRAGFYYLWPQGVTQ